MIFRMPSNARRSFFPASTAQKDIGCSAGAGIEDCAVSTQMGICLSAWLFRIEQKTFTTAVSFDTMPAHTIAWKIDCFFISQDDSIEFGFKASVEIRNAIRTVEHHRFFKRLPPAPAPSFIFHSGRRGMLGLIRIGESCLKALRGRQLLRAS
jgi:hypothetical protein